MIKTKLLSGACEACWAIPDGSKEPLPPYSASWVLEWPSDQPGTVYLRLLNGKLSRKILREMLALLTERGVVRVLAERNPQHSLPFGTTRADGLIEVDVTLLDARYGNKPLHKTSG